MAIPPTGASGTPTPPQNTPRAKAGEAVAAVPLESTPTANTTAALNQASNAASNPAGGAALTQAQADTAQVILKGPNTAT